MTFGPSVFADTATRLDVTLSGDGQAQLSQLTASEVHAVLTGSGLIQVTATSSLVAAVPGTGAILYNGNPPQVTSSVTGTGTVTRMSEGQASPMSHHLYTALAATRPSARAAG